MKSFRTRLVLLASGSATMLLLLVGSFAWRLTVNFNLAQLDRELRNLGAANLTRVVGTDHWRRVESALGFASGALPHPTYALWVANYEREIYRSPHWPRDLDPAEFPSPQEYEGGLTFERPPPPPREGVPISPSNPPLPRLVPYFLDARVDGHAWRLAVMGTPYTRLLLAANLDDFNKGLDRLRITYALLLVLCLVAIGSAAWFFATRALRPVVALTAAAEKITAEGLDQRIAAPAHDREFQRLISVFNAMIDRLEKGFLQARRFSADASHELKTPLARLQLELGQALSEAAPGSREQKTYASLIEEVQRLTAIVENLLLLSLADAGRLDLKRDRVDLSHLLANVAEDCASQAPELEVESSIQPGVQVLADPSLLEQALQNITTNAIKYNRPGGRIHLVLRSENTSAVVRIANSGQVLAPTERERIFQRFYRADPARSGNTGGHGLGLSLSREIIRAFGGEIVAKEAPPGLSVCLEVTLPLANDQSDN